MNFLQKLQNRSEKERKIILWATIAIIGVVSLSFLFDNFKKKLEEFKTEEFKEDLEIPSLEEEFENLPEFKIDG